MAPPLIKVRGAARAKGIPAGYVLGRVSGGTGDVELLRLNNLQSLGVAGQGDVAQGDQAIRDEIAALRFIDLADTPSAYPGFAGYVVAVKLTEDGLEFVPQASGGGGGVVYDDGTVPAGNTVANEGGETAFTSSYAFDPDVDPLVLNDVVRITLRGVYGTDGAVAPDLTLNIYFNSTLLASTGPITLATGQTNTGWEANILLIVTGAGPSGTVEVQGSAQLNGWQGMVNTADIAINTTTTQAVTAQVDWSAADVDNTITLRQMVIEHMAGANPAPPPSAAREMVVAGPDGAFYMRVTSGFRQDIVPTFYVNEG